MGARRNGKFVLYRLADEMVLELPASLRRVAEADKIIRGCFTQRDDMEPVTGEELVERARGSPATVLDVRPADERKSEKMITISHPSRYDPLSPTDS